MAKRKKTKGQTTIYKTLHREQQIEQNELLLNTGVGTQVLRKGKSFLHL